MASWLEAVQKKGGGERKGVQLNLGANVVYGGDMIDLVIHLVLNALCSNCIYSKTSLSRPVMEPPLNGSFRDVGGLGS